jgi:hypothetical protein
MALPVEQLDKDQLVEKQARRSLVITLLKKDTPVKVVQVKMTHAAAEFCAFGGRSEVSLAGPVNCSEESIGAAH